MSQPSVRNRESFCTEWKPLIVVVVFVVVVVVVVVVAVVVVVVGPRLGQN